METVNYSNFLFDVRLRASERLKSRSAIESLFKGAESEKAFPIRLVYRKVKLSELKVDERRSILSGLDTLDNLVPAQIGFVASKRTFKRATDRNFVKRRMREAYRLDKERFYSWCEKEQIFIQGMLIFTGRELPTQLEIIKAWGKLLRRLDGDYFS